MLNIKIDKNIMTYLGEKRLRIDELFVVTAFIVGKLDLVKTFLSGRSGDQCTAFMQSLERKGLMRKLSPMVEDFDWDNYAITEEGNVVYEDCISNITEGEMVIAMYLLPEVDAVSSEGELGEIVDAIYNLFPEDVRGPNGERVRSHKFDIEKKMKAFLKKYKFSKETILKATENYLRQQRNNGYAFCCLAHYFISKEGISKLASECEDAERNVGNTGTWENVM